jgi:hypothetical protein
MLAAAKRPSFPGWHDACLLVTLDTMRIAPVFAIPIVVASAFGCEAAPPRTAEGAASQEADVEITREAAVKMARTDAALRFRDFGGVSFVNAAMLGKYWVVELHATNGQGLRYAISRSGGAVKERTLIR